MKIKDLFIYFSAVIMILFGLIIILGATVSMLSPDPKHSFASNLALLIITGIFPFVLGLVIFRNKLKKSRARELDEMENRVLKLAKENDGKLTAGDLAMNTTFSAEESKKYLDALCIKGEVELFISDSGINVYKFKQIISKVEKEAAEKL